MAVVSKLVNTTEIRSKTQDLRAMVLM